MRKHPKDIRKPPQSANEPPESAPSGNKFGEFIATPQTTPPPSWTFERINVDAYVVNTNASAVEKRKRGRPPSNAVQARKQRIFANLDATEGRYSIQAICHTEKISRRYARLYKDEWKELRGHDRQ